MKILQIENAAPRTITVEMEFVLGYFGRCGDCTEQVPGLLISSSDDPDFPPSRVELDLDVGTYSLIIRSRPGGTSRVAVW